MSEEISLRSVAKFNGGNFQTWKFQMKTLFDYNDLSGVIDGTEILPPVVVGELATAEVERKAWKKKDAKARFFIITACDETQMEYLTVCDSAHEMWNKLSTIHEQRSATNKVSLMEDFHGYTMASGCGVAQHVARVQNLAFRLRDIGKVVDDDTIIAKITTTLPSRFHAFKSSWANIPENAQTITNLLDKLLQEEKHMEKEENAGQALVATVAKSTSKSKGSGAHGASGNSRASNYKRPDKKKCNVKCFKCGEKGHYARECTAKNDAKASGSSTDSSATCAFAFSSVFGLEDLASDDTWYLDSCASLHSTFRREWLRDFREDNLKNIKVGNDNLCPVKGCGSVTIVRRVNDEFVEGRIDNVYFVPSLRRNLLSAGQLTKKGIKVVLNESNEAELVHKGIKVAEGKITNNNVFALAFKTISVYEASSATCAMGIMELHERLGHVNVKTIERMIKFGLLPSVSLDGRKSFFCEACQEGKMHRSSYRPITSKRHTEPGEVIHSDVVGPIEVASVGQSKWYVNFKDDATDFRVIAFMKNKSEVFDKFKCYVATVENRFGRPIKVLRSDRGREFVNSEMRNFMEKKGIVHEVTAPYTPEQNGMAERDNRTITECVRTMLIAKGVSKRLWAEAAAFAVYILNRITNRKDQSVSPFEMWFGYAPDLTNVKTFGSLAYIHVPKLFRKKLDSKANKGIFVGYQGDSKNLRVYLPASDKIKESKDVVVYEGDIGQGVESVYECGEELEIPVPVNEEVVLEDQLQQDPVQEGNERDEIAAVDVPVDGPQWVRRSQRQRMMPDRYEASWASTEEPKTLEEAFSGPDRTKWERAVDEELLAHEQNGTWNIVENKGQRTVTSKWVFKVQDQRSGPRYKARLVARGFTQTQGIDYEETFSPVVRYDSLRVLLALVAQHDLEMKQFDVKTAFLYGNLEEDIYMEVPEGLKVNGAEDKVLKLVKSLYGLKQASRCWNKTFTKFLCGFNFVKAQADPCVFKGRVDCSEVILALYVDDGLVFSKSVTAIEQTVKALNGFVTLKILDGSSFCGMEIIRDEKSGSVFVHQEKYIEKLLCKFGLDACKTASVPIDRASMNQANEECMHGISKVPYREAVGSLMYVAVVSRPDIAFATSFVSRFLEKHSEACWKVVKKILCYLKLTKRVGLLYKREGNKQPVSYSDADYAGDQLTRKSMSGSVGLLAGAPVTWNSRRQSCVALSTTESEFIAASEAVKDVIWIRKLLIDVGHECADSTQLYVDNQSAIRLAKNSEFHKRTKHIDVRYYILRESCEKEIVAIDYICTENQLADILTKPLGQVRHKSLCGKMNIKEFNSGESVGV